MNRAIWLLIPLMSASGCSTTSSLEAEAGPAISGVGLDQVVLRIKQEVRVYEADANQRRNGNPDELGHDVDRLCPGGMADFDISEVEIELKTVVTESTNVNASLTIPFASGTSSISPGGGAGRAMTNVQDLTFHVYPVVDRTVTVPDVVRQRSRIAASINQLRASLMKAAALRPCFRLDGKDGKDNTFQISFEVVKDSNIDLGFSFVLVSAKGTLASKTDVSNSLIVHFKPLNRTQN